MPDQSRDDSRGAYARRQFVAAGLCALAHGQASAQPPSHSKAAKISVAAASLKPDVIASKDIISGSPRAGDLVFSKSEDGRETRGIWSCTPGSFHWTFDTDETAIILQGAVAVRLEDGTALELKPGDLACFSRGAKTVWTVHETLRKVYVLYH